VSADAGERADHGSSTDGDDVSDADGPNGRSGTSPGSGPTAGSASGGDADADGFGPRGWVLVGVVVLSTAVIPGLVYAFPALPADAGIPFLVAMLVLPMLPAVLLGAAAVWSMSAATGTADEAD
jgi:hypothetical protein